MSGTALTLCKTVPQPNQIQHIP